MARGVCGCGLLDLGAEKVRMGRGRRGVGSGCPESELLTEITEEFLLRSDNEGESEASCDLSERTFNIQRKQ